MHYLPTSNVTRVMVNFRVSGKEKAELDALVGQLQAKRDQRYQCRGGYVVSASDVLRWGIEALRRELAADQAAADAAEYNAKHPAKKPSPAKSPATKRKSSSKL